MTLIEIATTIEATKKLIGEAELALHVIEEEVEVVKDKHKAEMAGLNLLVSEKESDLKSKTDQLKLLFTQMHDLITVVPEPTKVVAKAAKTTQPTDAELKQLALDGMKFRSRG